MIKNIEKLGVLISKNEQKNISGGYAPYDCIFWGTCDQTVLCECTRYPDTPPQRVSSCDVCEQICGKGWFFCYGQF